jgi:hypothetical protein
MGPQLEILPLLLGAVISTTVLYLLAAWLLGYLLRDAALLIAANGIVAVLGVTLRAFGGADGGPLDWSGALAAQLPASLLVGVTAYIIHRGKLHREQTANSTPKAETVTSNQDVLGMPVGPTAHAGPGPRPWARYFAKSVDINLYLLVFIALNIVLVLRLGDGFIIPEGDELAAGLVIFAVFPIYDALLLRTFGNTVGRSLLGFRMKSERETPIEFATLVNRNYHMFAQGLGLGLPIISLFTAAKSYQHLTQENSTPWDTRNGIVVEHHHPGAWRAWAGAAIAAILFGLITATSVLPARAHNPYLDQFRRELPLAEELRLWRAEMNDLAPTMVDDITRLDGAEVDGSSATVRYSIISEALDHELMASWMHENIPVNACSDEFTRASIARGAQYTYSYSLPDGHSIEVVVSTCPAE